MFKELSTKRLLRLYRRLRTALYLAHHSSMGISDDEYEQIEQDHQTLEAMKTELDTREHIPRERPIKKQKRVLKYRR